VGVDKKFKNEMDIPQAANFANDQSVIAETSNHDKKWTIKVEF
jgi:hypothetical protein